MLVSHAYSLPRLVSKHATTLVVIPMKSPPCTSIEPRFKEILLYASARNAPVSQCNARGLINSNTHTPYLSELDSRT